MKSMTPPRTAAGTEHEYIITNAAPGDRAITVTVMDHGADGSEHYIQCIEQYLESEHRDRIEVTRRRTPER